MKKDEKKNVKPKEGTQAAEQTEEVKAAEGEIDPEQMSEEDYVASLETKLGEALAETAATKALAQRIQADFDNYRKRNSSIAEDMKALGQSIVIEKLLSVLDNCDLARKYVSDEAALTGFNMMEAQLLTALEGFGLKEIEALGADFDASKMNAVERVKDEQNDGKVVEVLLKGYTLLGKLLRPASVKVGYCDKQAL